MSNIQDTSKNAARPSHEALDHREGENDTPERREEKSALESSRKAENTIKQAERGKGEFTK